MILHIQAQAKRLHITMLQNTYYGTKYITLHIYNFTRTYSLKYLLKIFVEALTCNFWSLFQRFSWISGINRALGT